MAQFVYLARAATGQKIEGTLEIADTGALAEILAAQGLTLVRANARSATNAVEAGGWKLQLFGERITLLDLILFCRQMATLLKAGVPVLRSLKGLEESATNRRFAAVLASLQQQLESGREMSFAMKQHPEVFDNFAVSTVRVGEVTGRLPEAFSALYTQISFQRETQEQVRAALRYPTFVIATGVAALVAVNLFVIPAFAKIYHGMKAELPLLTRILIGVSDFFVHQWLVMLLVGGGAAALATAWRRTAGGERVIHALVLRLPIIGDLIQKASIARFTNGFGLALAAGVPAVDALKVAVETTGNVVLAERIGTIREAAERGESLARSARATGVFTPTVLQMIAVGEETGALAEMMTEVSGHYQKEVEYAIKTLGARIEPIMIIVLGGFVLVLALGVFLPMWDLAHVTLKHG
jgi:MSHA biogenesis protein MshG